MKRYKFERVRVPFARRSKRLRWDTGGRNGWALLYVGDSPVGGARKRGNMWVPRIVYGSEGPPMRRRVDAKRWVECEVSKGAVIV
jgi:hypothetical protein